MNDDDLLSYALKGDGPAIECAKILVNASQVLDDLWDGDKPVDRTKLFEMILSLLVDLNRNAFFIQLREPMTQAVEDALMQWVAANDIEEDGEDARELLVAYVIRSSTTDLLIKMARLLGGRAWERTVAKKVRAEVYGSNESFEEYRQEVQRTNACV